MTLVLAAILLLAAGAWLGGSIIAVTAAKRLRRCETCPYCHDEDIDR